MEGAKKQSRGDYRMGPWRRTAECVCVCVWMGMTVLGQSVWLIGPCRTHTHTHTGRIDQLIVCLSFQEDQRRPRPPVALCLFLSIFFLPFFFHLLLLSPVCSFTAYLAQLLGYRCYRAEIIADTRSL